MKKYLMIIPFLSLFLFSNLESLEARTIQQSFDDAERFLEVIYPSYNQNDLDLMANSIWFAFRQGSRNLPWDYTNESVLPLIMNPTNEQLALEEVFLKAYYQEGLLTFQRTNPTSTSDINTLLEQTYETAFNDGYSSGLIASETEANIIVSFIPQLLGVVFAFFFTILSFQVFGVSALNIIGTLLALSVGILTYKIFFGR